MQVMIPISSRTKFFPETEYFFPKPLITIDGKSMIERIVDNIKSYVNDPNFIFIVDNADCDRFSLDKLLKILGGDNTKIVKKRRETAGALCSAMLAIDHLDLNEPLLISNCDTLLTGDISHPFSQVTDAKYKAGTFTFPSIHPRWSYVRSSNDFEIEQVYEKQVISKQAIAGLYYFQRAGDLIKAGESVILSGASVDNKFFISSTFNQLILQGEKVRFLELEENQVHSFYSPEAIEQFEKRGKLDVKDEEVNCVNIVIPAAGLGSRFAKEGWQKPKPFIDTCGKPMILNVIENLKTDYCNFHILMRSEHVDNYPEEVRELKSVGANLLTVPKLTEGTACTVLSAERIINNDDMLIIANSDQIVDFSIDAFIKDCRDRSLDGSILVFQDSKRDPKWSFAKTSHAGYVTEVAEKKPISNLATVGIYLFRTGSSFVRGAVEMIVANDRVNDEFYTCPVYNYLISSGLKIGVYEVPQESMHGIGTPTDLKNYLTKQYNTISRDAPQ